MQCVAIRSNQSVYTGSDPYRISTYSEDHVAKKSPNKIIDSLAARGITLHTDGERIWPEPKASLAPEDHAAIDKHRGELLEHLTPEKPAPTTKEPDAVS